MLYSFFSIMPIFVNLFAGSLFYLFEATQNNSKRFLALFFGRYDCQLPRHIGSISTGNMNSIPLSTAFGYLHSLASYPLYHWYIRTLTTDVEIDWRRSPGADPRFSYGTVLRHGLSADVATGNRHLHSRHHVS